MRTSPLLLIAVIALAGCAGQIYGTVVPIENDHYKAVSIDDDKRNAYKMASNDAKVTCKREGRDGYTVVSQDVQEPEAPQVKKTGNRWADSLLSVAEAGYAHQYGETEVTTIFHCR